MVFINRSYEDFLEHVKGKPIMLLGASSAWHYYVKVFPWIVRDVLGRTYFIVDNDLWIEIPPSGFVAGKGCAETLVVA